MKNALLCPNFESNALMGNALIRNPSPSPGEPNIVVVIPSKLNEMAEQSLGDAYKQQQDVFEAFNTCFSQVQISNQRFLECGNFIVQRQRMLESEIETSRERLARFSRDHARQGQTNVENVTSANRPSVLEGNFVIFRDCEGMDAVEALQKMRSRSKGQDPWKDEFLDKYVACMIFEHSYDAARSLKTHFLQGMNLILTSAPAIAEQFSEQGKKKANELHFSIDIGKTGSYEEGIGDTGEDSLAVILRETAGKCDVSSLAKRTLAAISKMQANGALEDYNRDFMENRKLKKYVEECCKYAWNLVCQTPPYEIEGNLSFRKQNKIFDPAKHVCPYSNQDSSIIYAVTWPSLIGPSKRVIRKAEVLLEVAPAKSSRASMH